MDSAISAKIEYVFAEGMTMEDMIDHLAKSTDGINLINNGDVVSVWVNQGDIDIHDMNIELGGYI